MNGFIRLNDFRDLISFKSPLFAFIVPWLFVLIGQSMQLCNIIVPHYSTFYLVVIGNILSFLLIAVVIQICSPQNLRKESLNFGELKLSKRFRRMTYLLLGFYFFCQIFQVIHFRGFPLLWLVIGSSKVYVDYGIHSLNGLLNAIFLLSSTGFFLMYLEKKSILKFFFILLLLLVPVLLVSRQLLLSLFLQITCCSILYYPNSVRKIIKYGVALLAVFIFLGNYRTGLDVVVEILQPKPFVPKVLYPLLWIYAYVVTPFNNINANIDHITPLGEPYYELNALLPSFLSGTLGSAGQTGYSLVHSNMTVSTFYYEALLDFGSLYAFLFMVVFQLIFFLSYRRALRSKSVVHTIEYAVLYMISVLSIFSNLLLFLPIVFQLVILNLAKLKLFRKRGFFVFALEEDC